MYLRVLFGDKDGTIIDVSGGTLCCIRASVTSQIVFPCKYHKTLNLMMDLLLMYMLLASSFL